MKSSSLSRRHFMMLSGAACLVPLCSQAQQAGLLSGAIRPESYGARSTATAGGDDTQALQAALDALGSQGDELQLTRTYTVSRRLVLAGKKNFRITGGGRIVAAAGMPVASGGQCLYLEDCSDFEIEGITVDGNRDARAAREVAAHALELRSCRRYVVRGVRIANSVTDCLYLSCAPNEVSDRSRHNQQAEFLDCEFDHGFRQGVSIIQGNHIRFVRCRFANSRGTAPEAGIDLESNARDLPNAIHDISFEDCTFEGNRGYGLLVGSAKTPLGISAVRCVFKDNGAGAVSFNGSGGELSDCVFAGFPNANSKRGCIDVGASPEAGNLDIRRARFVELGVQSPANYLLYVHRASAGKVRLIDTVETRASLIAALRAPGCEVQGGRYTGAGAGAVALLGDRCAARGATFAGFAGEAIRIAGTGCEVTGCSFEEPAGQGSGAAVVVLDQASAAIRNNRFRRRARSGAAIVLARAAVAELRDNSVAGYAALSQRR